MAIKANALKTQTYMRTKGGFNPSPLDMPIAASQVLHQYDPLKLSSGKITKIIAPSGSADTAVLIGAGAICIGVVAQSITVDASGVSTDGRAVTTVPVIPVWACEFMMGGYNATPGSAEPQDFTLSTSYELVNVTLAAATGWTWACATSTTNANLRYIARSEESAADEDFGYLWVEYLRASTIGV